MEVEQIAWISIGSVATNAILYFGLSRCANKNVSTVSLLFMTTSLFSALVALCLLNIDVYQSITGQRIYELYISWRVFYWVSFVYGYGVFVVLSERDRFVGSRSIFWLFVGFYRDRLLIFLTIGIAAITVLVLLIQRGTLGVSTLDLLPKALANSWGLLLIVAILGYSLPNVLKRLRRQMSPEKSLKHKLTRLGRLQTTIEELTVSLEFKLPFLHKKLSFINHPPLTQKFSNLTAMLPSDIGQNSHDLSLSEVLKFNDDSLMDETESEIQALIVAKRAEKRTVQALIKLIAIHSLSIPNVKLAESLAVRHTSFANRFYHRKLRPLALTLLYIYGWTITLLIVAGITANGFGLPRVFLSDWLKQLNFPLFILFFNAYLVYFSYLIVHGVGESRLQGFRGLHGDNITDTQSMLYWTR